MAEYREFSAKSVSDCITDACMTFSVTSDRLDYEVVTEGSSGFIGIGVKPAVIKARIKEESFAELEAAQAKVTAAEENAKKEKAEREKAEKAAKREAEKKQNAERAAAIREREGIPEVTEEDVKAWKERRKQERRERNGRGRRDERRSGEDRRHYDKEEKFEKTEEPAKELRPIKPLREIPEEEKAQLIAEAEKFLKDVFASMKIEVNITSSFGEDNTLNVDLAGEDMGLLIGKRGQTLDSLQYLTSLVLNKDSDDYLRIKIDTENYRSRRKETLEKLARNIAFKVKRGRRPVALEPMNPYERRIIHSALQNDRYVTTHSEGEEPYRKVVVTLKSGR
ncbi:MAG: KH domain-containing protein [Lachnospiraceae bacterium]|nr:KH domain-containing protein [Lachnospiraceae bacterium]